MIRSLPTHTCRLSCLCLISAPLFVEIQCGREGRSRCELYKATGLQFIFIAGWRAVLRRPVQWREPSRERSGPCDMPGQAGPGRPHALLDAALVLPLPLTADKLLLLLTADKRTTRIRTSLARAPYCVSSVQYVEHVAMAIPQ